MQSTKCQYHEVGCDGECWQADCQKLHTAESRFCSEECREEYWGEPNKKTGFEEKMRQAALFREYNSMTTEELKKRRGDAAEWLAEKINKVPTEIYAEANRRYMAIEDVLNERNVEETLLKQ